MDGEFEEKQNCFGQVHVRMLCARIPQFCRILICGAKTRPIGMCEMVTLFFGETVEA